MSVNSRLKATLIMCQKKAFYKQIIPGSNCVRKETVDIHILVTSKKCLIRVESSIISMDSNITDNIIRKVINVYQEKCRTKNGALRNSSIRWIFLSRFQIKIHAKPKISSSGNKKTTKNTLNKNSRENSSAITMEKLKCWSKILNRR